LPDSAGIHWLNQYLSFDQESYRTPTNIVIYYYINKYFDLILSKNFCFNAN
jgi:hypothetical protein